MYNLFVYLAAAKESFAQRQTCFGLQRYTFPTKFQQAGKAKSKLLSIFNISVKVSGRKKPAEGTGGRPQAISHGAKSVWT